MVHARLKHFASAVVSMKYFFLQREQVPMVRLSTVAVGFLLILLICDILTLTESAIYEFKRYEYRKKRDDRRYRNRRGLCETAPDCTQVVGLEQIKCIRKCVSEYCFEQLYGNDELEEGEIDIRFNSYKGCLNKEPMNNN